MLRIEDTDRTRYVDGSIENLLQVLASVGLIPDEGPNNPGNTGPYLQSERLDIYNKYIDELIEKKHAYYCFCTSERLEELRAEQTSLGLPTKYDGKCRYLSEEEIQANLDAGKPYTVRLAVPKNMKVSFEDVIRGKIEVDTKDIDDQVLLKSDGFPTYHMANIVDDHLMGVTHVIRGEEWTPSTPKHVLLYDAFGWEKPVFAHIPLLLGTDKKKMSKRVGDVSVESYLQKGYLPEAIINYISLLGWNPKTTEEIFTLEELIQRFELSDVHKAGAVFDVERLEWFNAKYISSYDVDTLYNKIMTYLKRYDEDFKLHIESFPESYTKKILSELKTRVKKLSELKDLTHFFYNETGKIKMEVMLNQKMKVESTDDAKSSLELALDVITNKDIDFESIESIKTVFIEEIKAAEKKNGQVLWPVRVALSNEQFSPGALELLHILGKEKSIERIEKVLKEI